MALVDEAADLTPEFQRRIIGALARKVRSVMQTIPLSDDARAYCRRILLDPIGNAGRLAPLVRVAVAIAAGNPAQDPAVQSAVDAVVDIEIAAGVN